MATDLISELQTLIKNTATNTKPPMKCTIKKIYEDKNHADIITVNGELKYVNLIGINVNPGDEGIVVFLDEVLYDYIVIANNNSSGFDFEHIYNKSEVDNLISGVVAGENSFISFGQVDSTSTATVFTATVPHISELTDGTTVMLKNGVVTSASGFTLEVNGLGAKPVYSNMAEATRDTTIFNVAYTMLFVYDSSRVDGGCWVCYRGYDSNTNTIGYQIRTNSTKLTATDKGYRYRLWLETVDNKFMPVNTSTSTNATANRSSSMNTREFWLNGRILYNATNGTTDANALMSASNLWQQYTFALGYSFNNTGSALNMTIDKPLYMVAEYTGNGKAKLKTPYYTQTLPTEADGKLYIYLGHMYSATNIELALDHPIYEYRGGALRLFKEDDIENDYNIGFTYSFGLGGIDDTLVISPYIQRI